MWQAPNQRVRAASNAKKREREKNRKPIHLKRINAQLELNSTPQEGAEKVSVRILLNDLSTKGVGLFSPHFLAPGQMIILTITDPLQITLHARVIWCQEHSANSHVITNHSYSYRLGIEFTLETLEEQQSIKAFCDEVAKTYLYSPKAV